MGKDNLKHKAATGMVWTAIQKYSKMLITFISGIILARLLMPEDYGAIGMLAIFRSLALIRKYRYGCNRRRCIRS